MGKCNGPSAETDLTQNYRWEGSNFTKAIIVSVHSLETFSYWDQCTCPIQNLNIYNITQSTMNIPLPPNHSTAQSGSKRFCS